MLTKIRNLLTKKKEKNKLTKRLLEKAAKQVDQNGCNITIRDDWESDDSDHFVMAIYGSDNVFASCQSAYRLESGNDVLFHTNLIGNTDLIIRRLKRVGHLDLVIKVLQERFRGE